MSILGIGIDIVENYRIKKILVNKKLKFKTIILLIKIGLIINNVNT